MEGTANPGRVKGQTHPGPLRLLLLLDYINIIVGSSHLPPEYKWEVTRTLDGEVIATNTTRWAPQIVTDLCSILGNK